MICVIVFKDIAVIEYLHHKIDDFLQFNNIIFRLTINLALLYICNNTDYSILRERIT